MKKFIFVLILIPPVLLYSACEEPPPDEIIDDGDIPDVVITEDWRYITIYLDGAHLNPAVGPSTPATNKRATKSKLAQSPQVNARRDSAPEVNSRISAESARRDSRSESRAMTTDTARRGFDFFEAAFFANGANMRASWEIGTRASVYDVPRDIDYSRVSVDANGGGEAAILFAGRKRDKTLLAVGKIVSVDDVPGTFITSDSSFVTFEVFAITARICEVQHAQADAKGLPVASSVRYNVWNSGFVTAYSDEDASEENTRIMKAIIGGRYFPLYKLPPGQASVKARYLFDLDGAAWSDFAGGVLVSSVRDGNSGGIESGSATIRNPRYPAGNGRYWYPIYPMDVTTNVKMTNNQKAGRPVDNNVVFDFDTSESTVQKMGIEIGLFTLAFRIPVTPLVKSEIPGLVSPSEDGEGEIASGVTWFIRPAYQSYYYNIDDGIDSYGGGVLMGAFGAHESELIIDRRSS